MVECPDRGDGTKSRIYMSVKGRQKGDDTFMSQWSNALCVAYKVLDLRDSLAGFQKLKVSGPDMSPSRHDNVVIWLTGHRPRQHQPTQSAGSAERAEEAYLSQPPSRSAGTGGRTAAGIAPSGDRR